MTVTPSAKIGAEPSINIAGGDDASVLACVEAAVAVAKGLGFRHDASESLDGRVTVEALWNGETVTLTMQFFKKKRKRKAPIFLASRTNQSAEVMVAGGGQQIELLFYTRLSEDTTRRGLEIFAASPSESASRLGSER